MVAFISSAAAATMLTLTAACSMAAAIEDWLTLISSAAAATWADRVAVDSRPGRHLVGDTQLGRGFVDPANTIVDIAEHPPQVHCHFVERFGKNTDFILLINIHGFGKIAIGHGFGQVHTLEQRFGDRRVGENRRLWPGQCRELDRRW